MDNSSRVVDSDGDLSAPIHVNTIQTVAPLTEGFLNFCAFFVTYTDYSVKSSTWRNGYGDVVGDLALAANQAGIQLGIYLSPWDRHEVSYGNTLEYNEYYMAQMMELLTRYGNIKEVWLDGAKGEGEKDMEYFFENWFSLIHQLQPDSVIFSDAGPDVRWVGDEGGYASTTCWSLFNRSNAAIGVTDPNYSQGGDPLGHDWVPPECDVSIRPGWFSEQKPQLFLLAAQEQGQTIYVGGLMRLDLIQASVHTIYVTVWASPNVSLHLGKTENADETWSKHAGVRLQPPIGVDRVFELGKWESREVKVSGTIWDVNSIDLSVAGLGWFSVGLKGETTLSLWTFDGIEITYREPLVLKLAPFLERPGFLLPKAISEALAKENKTHPQNGDVLA